LLESPFFRWDTGDTVIFSSPFPVFRSIATTFPCAGSAMALELDYSSAHADGHRPGSMRRAEFFRHAAMTSFMAGIPVKAILQKGRYHMEFQRMPSNAMVNTSTTKDKPSAGDPIAPKCALIEVHVSELKQLFDAIDPSPFRDRDLDPKAEEFIVGWAKDLPRDAKLALVVDVDREAGLPEEAALLRDAIHEFFRHRAESTDNVCGNYFVWAGPVW
jgi:hypothetical protein